MRSGHGFKRARWFVVVGLTAAGWALSPLVAFSADNGTVPASVLAGISPCITITSPSPAVGSVNFGNLPFSPQGSVNFSEGSGTPDITVASCASSGQTLLARGSHAVGTTDPNTVWTLAASIVPIGQTCGPTAPLNVYRLGLGTAGLNEYLTTNNAAIGSLAGSASTFTRTPLITMPCAGSSGNGDSMTMAFTFTATLP
jgi:hypothetical protein